MAAAGTSSAAPCPTRSIATPSSAPCISGAAEPVVGHREPGQPHVVLGRGDRPAYDPDRARSAAGRRWVSPAERRPGRSRTRRARPCASRFLVQKGIAGSEKGAAFLRERFARVGVGMDVVAARPRRGDDGRWARAITTRSTTTSISPIPTRPATSISGCRPGSTHLWHSEPAAASRPVGSARRRAHGEQASALDLAERQRLFADVQRTLAEQVPALSFATPHVFVGTSARVTGGAAGGAAAAAAVGRGPDHRQRPAIAGSLPPTRAGFVAQGRQLPV